IVGGDRFGPWGMSNRQGLAPSAIWATSFRVRRSLVQNPAGTAELPWPGRHSSQVRVLREELICRRSGAGTHHMHDASTPAGGGALKGGGWTLTPPPFGWPGF